LVLEVVLVLVWVLGLVLVWVLEVQAKELALDQVMDQDQAMGL
jgi:hypothetical protein